ncbi:copper homeostasis protein CutC [Aeromonas enteropelogenes]|nr:copper homeostasis protein CutC [Aeromonas sp. FDAARGOS 1407]
MESTWAPSDDGRVNITDGAKVATVRALLDRP